MLDRYLNQRGLNHALVFFSILLGYYFSWDIQNIALFSFVIWIILYPISNRFLALTTIFFLSFIPLLLIIDRDEQAEEFANYAYYFLALTVIGVIIESRRRRKINPPGK